MRMREDSSSMLLQIEKPADRCSSFALHSHLKNAVIILDSIFSKSRMQKTFIQDAML